jgi:hypothetical protein
MVLCSFESRIRYIDMIVQVATFVVLGHLSNSRNKSTVYFVVCLRYDRDGSESFSAGLRVGMQMMETAVQ